MRPLVALALLAAVAPAAPVPNALKDKDETAKLIGRWKPDKGSEWFEFTAEGGMKAWSTGSEASAAQYTFELDTDADARGWRMTWSQKGQAKPTYYAVYVVDGDRLHLSYTSFQGKPPTKPGPTTPTNFTRDPVK
jgi:hypothetical protein